MESPLIKKGRGGRGRGRGIAFQKLSYLGGKGDTKFFSKKVGVNLKRGSWCRNEGVATFFTTLEFSSIIFTFSDLQSFELAMQDFHQHSHPRLVLKPFSWNYAADTFYGNYAGHNVCCIYAGFEVVVFVTGVLVDLSVAIKQVTVSIVIMRASLSFIAM